MVNCKRYILSIMLLMTLSTTTVLGSEVKPTLNVIKEELIKTPDRRYNVKGIVYNPNDQAVKNVEIKYYIWGKYLGTDVYGIGKNIKKTGGLVVSYIKNIEPKSSVEFIATSNNALVMSEESGLLPDPLKSEVTAEWISSNSSSFEQKILFNVESVKYKHPEVCKLACKFEYNDPPIDSMLSNGWRIISSSPKEATVEDEYGCFCVGNQYVLQKDGPVPVVKPETLCKNDELQKKEIELLKRENDLLKQENESLKEKIKPKLKKK